jgi:Protein of unknown function (DUF1097)
MSTKLKLTLPLALTIAVLSFVYVEFAANFSFHWVTSGSLGNGLDMPAKFHLIIPAAFLTWGLFFVLGANNEAAKLVAINTLIGAGAGLLLFFMTHEIKQQPDFWGISLSVGILAFVIVMGSALTDLVNVPTIFVTFAGTIFWWLATGADGWFPGSNVAHSPQGLAAAAAGASKGLTAGSGAFGGVISTPYGFVALNMAVTMLIGIVFGMASVRIAALLSPKTPEAAAVDEHAEGARPNPA